MRALAIVVLLCAMSATSAWGTNYTYSTTIDLSTATYSTSGSFTTINFNLPSGQPTFQLNLGDTLSGTVNFNGSINLSTPATFDVLNFSIDDYENYLNSTIYAIGSVGLLGVNGQLSIHNPEANENSDGNEGLPLEVVDFINDPKIGIEQSTPISFTGFSYDFTITRQVVPQTSFFPGNLQFTEVNQNLSITVVPEPQTWRLLLGGLTFLVLLRGRRYLETR